MIILLIFAFISGLVTIFAPCIWPLLPIILAASSTGEKKKPLGITIGVVSSFVLFTLSISYLVRLIPFDPNIFRLFAVIVIGFFGLVLILPGLNQVVEGWVSRLSGGFGKTITSDKKGFRSGIVTGFALGIVWAPCAGPILATIATLAATQAVTLSVILVTIAYGIGVGIPLFFFALAGSHLFSKSKRLSKYTGLIQQIFGVIMIVTAFAILTNLDKTVQVKLLDAFPSYSNLLYKLEGNAKVQQELNELRGAKNSTSFEGKPIDMLTSNQSLPNLGQAPEFVGITKWLNLPEGQTSLTMEDLRGKVVLVDFWTYTCINCIRTFPFVTNWYEKYKDKGFVIVGIHTPEFEFEKNTNNVLGAIKQYNISYPVAQDNNYQTWSAYNNQYWPAHYLIDAKGRVRYTHFGEGSYDETEHAIQELLKEKGVEVEDETVNVKDTTPRTSQTPETYLGEQRIERFASNESIKEGKGTYTLPEALSLHYFAYEGLWNVQREYAEAGKNAALELRFLGPKANLVIVPKTSVDKVRVIIDGVDKGYVPFDSQNPNDVYTLIDLKGKSGEHLLRLEFETEGTKIYAFTFG